MHQGGFTVNWCGGDVMSMVKELIDLLSHMDVVSFDVFDTLVFRSYLTQEDLWRDLGRRELGEGKESAFLKARVKADRLTYRTATAIGGEHTLHGAYEKMPRKFAALEEFEERLQRDCLAVNPEMLAVWKRAGELAKKRIIVSDMYLTESWFAGMLKEKGIEGWDRLYISSEQQARKSTGRLFELVRKDFPSQKILHIGDDEHSDVKMAESAGFEAYHYPNLRDEVFAQCPFLERYMSEWPSFEKRRQVGVLVRGWKLLGGCELNYWKRFGYFMGGVLGHLYVKWLSETAKACGIRHLMFVARDGYLWQKMFDRLNTGIKTDYFYAPRLTSVKVCGVIGTDPAARAERQSILDSLPDNKPSKELTRYQGYLSRYEIDGTTAIVDGCSSAFSVQRLVEAAVGRPVPAFYLMAYSSVETGDALFERCGASWQMLSEFIFSSPESPIDDVEVKGPTYRDSVTSEEVFRQSVFGDVASGALAGFDVLEQLNFGSEISRQDWFDYFLAFRSEMMYNDEEHLQKAQNAWQIGQENYVRIVNRECLGKEMRCLGIKLGVWRCRECVKGDVRRFFLFGHWQMRPLGYCLKRGSALAWHGVVLGVKCILPKRVYWWVHRRLKGQGE